MDTEDIAFSGLPARPVGGSEACSRIAAWLYPSREQRPLSNSISDTTDAYRWVYAVAADLLNDLRAEELSLHYTAERDRLKAIIKASNTLSVKLKAYAKPQGHLQHVAFACGFLEQVEDENGAGYKSVSADDILSKPLSLLVERLEIALAQLEAISGRDRDKIFARIHGHPKKVLTTRCAALLVAARGSHAAPIKEGGPVAELARQVWVYATGVEIGPDDDFDRVAKEGARVAHETAFRYPPGHLRGNKSLINLSLLP